MDETTTIKDPLPAKGPASEGKEGSTSSNPRTYTEEENRKAVSDALAKAGRDAKAIEVRESRLKDIEAREQALKVREEEAETRAAGNDPEKLSALELRRRTQDEADAIKAAREKLEAEKIIFQERLSKADELERDADIAVIAGNFQDGDTEKLKALSLKIGLKTREQIQAAAEIIFTQNPGEAFKPDSGVTKGGALDYSRMKPEDKFRLGLEAERKNKK